MYNIRNIVWLILQSCWDLGQNEYWKKIEGEEGSRKLRNRREDNVRTDATKLLNTRKLC